MEEEPSSKLKGKYCSTQIRLDKAMASQLSSTQERNQLREELNKAYYEEEIYWKQKTRNNCLKAGDKNTKFFHSVAKTRRIRNTLNTILDENSIIQRGDTAIREVAGKYFQKLYSSEQVSEEVYTKVFDGFEERISDEINTDLTRNVTKKEIEDAVFLIGPNRAPGPYCFSGAFYQQFWKDIKPAIINEIQSFFQ